MAVSRRRPVKDAGSAPVVLLAGEDREARDRYLASLRARLPEANREIAVERFGSGELPRALDAARTVPLFGERRLVVVHDVDWLSGRGGEAARTALAEYLERPSPAAQLVLVASKVDRRLAVVKAIERAGAAVSCDPPREREMAAWLRERARERGFDLPARAAAALADAVGANTGLAARELDKLALLVRGGKGRVSLEMVEQALGPSRAVGAFALEDALLEGRRVPALEALARHLAGGGPGEHLALLGRLAAISRRLAVARAVVAGGGGEDDVRERLGCHPFVARKYTRAAGRPGLRPGAGLAAAVRADRAIKSGGDGPAALREIVVALVTAAPDRT